MKRVFLFVLLIINGMMAFAKPSVTEKDVLDMVARMQKRYPRITLCDIYKSCFQDCFGPGHIIESKEKSENYLRMELERTDSMSVEIEPTGFSGNFVRVDVYFIKENRVSIDFYLDCLIRSVAEIDDAAINQWLEDWEFMQKVIEMNDVEIENYDDDKVFINQRIANGIYEMNHSRLFNELYHPHYRIIRRDIWEKELKPLIK